MPDHLVAADPGLLEWTGRAAVDASTESEFIIDRVKNALALAALESELPGRLADFTEQLGVLGQLLMVRAEMLRLADSGLDLHTDARLSERFTTLAFGLIRYATTTLDTDDDEASAGRIKDDVRIARWEASSDPLFLGVHAEDVDQNGLGDCYFVAPMAALASRDPGFIRDAITDNGDDTYTVRLFEESDGELVPVFVTVDNTFPVMEQHDKKLDTWVENDRYTAGPGDGELWPRIVEKAYAVHLGDGDPADGYREIIGGDGRVGLEVLTGVRARTESDDLSLEELRDMHDNGLVVPASQRFVPGSGFLGRFRDTGRYQVDDRDQSDDHELNTRHQYWVEDVRDDGTIVVQNPWEYGGREMEMTIDEFNEAFREVDVTEPDPSLASASSSQPPVRGGGPR